MELSQAKAWVQQAIDLRYENPSMSIEEALTQVGVPQGWHALLMCAMVGRYQELLDWCGWSAR